MQCIIMHEKGCIIITLRTLFFIIGYMRSYSYTCWKCLIDSGIPFFIIILPKFIDFGKARTLISVVINQINELRSEEEFSTLLEQTKFCVENNIDPNVKVKQRRQRTVSTRF